MEEMKKVSVFKAVAVGTGYMFRNIHFILLCMIPLIGFWAFEYLGKYGIMTNPMQMITPLFYIGLFIGMLIGLWFYNYLVLRTAAMPDVLNLQVEDKAMTALKRLPGALAAYCMYSAGIMLAFILLIIPGIIVAVVWSMTGFVFIMNGGIVKSYEEGRELVRGYGWKVFGLAALYMLLMIILMVPMMMYPGLFMSPWAIVLSTVYTLIMFLFIFWMLALYKQLCDAKQFVPDADRKGKNSFYKVFLVLSIIIGIAAIGAHAYTFISVMPKMYEKMGLEMKTDGKKTVTYKSGIPVSAVQYNDDGSISHTYYHANGNVKMETTMKFLSMVGQQKQYYENGILKELSTYEKGKLSGERLHYDESGSLIKRCIYKDDVLESCEDIRPDVKKKK